MKESPMISVIVPIFKMEKYIRQCVESILKQNYEDFELILVDDGSPDTCPAICDEYAKIDNRIKVIHKANEGVSAARNDGIKFAKGQYVTFVDADDLLPECALEKYISYLENSKCDAIMGNHILDYNGKRISKNARLNAGEYEYKDLKDRIIDDGTLTGFLFGSVWGGIYKRDVLTKNNIVFDKTVRVNEDGLFNLKFVYECNKILVINEYVYIYRQWKGNIKKNNLKVDERFENCEIVLNDYLNSKSEDFFIQLQRRKVSIAFWNAIRIQENRCNWKQAKRYLRFVLSSDELKQCYDFLDYSKMNIYKKVLCGMLKKNMLFLFYVSVKYFAPIIEKIVQR